MGRLGGLLLFFWLFRVLYEPILRLVPGATRSAVPERAVALSVLAGSSDLARLRDGVRLRARHVGSAVGFDEDEVRNSDSWVAPRMVPGLGKEFMPSLDEGSFLLMPVTMFHASIGEALEVVAKQDMAIRAIPEVEEVVGKIGRAESPLDPAPVSMIETIITYKSEYRTSTNGRLLRFRYDEERGEFVRGPDGLSWSPTRGPDVPAVAARDRQGRRHLERRSRAPLASRAPRLASRAAADRDARIVMLADRHARAAGSQGLRPGPGDDRAGRHRVRAATEGGPVGGCGDGVRGPRRRQAVPRDRHRPRRRLRATACTMRAIQDVIEVAIGGRRVTTTVEGRQRYPVRVRYMRELRDQRREPLSASWSPGAGGVQIPLGELAEMTATGRDRR